MYEQTAPTSRQSRALGAVQPATSPFGLSQARVTCLCLQVYEAEGPSKKKAENVAAEKAVEVLRSLDLIPRAPVRDPWQVGGFWAPCSGVPIGYVCYAAVVMPINLRLYVSLQQGA